MAPKTWQRKTALEQLKDLEGAVAVNLPPGVCLTICGMPQGVAEIAEALERCREYLEAYPTRRERAAERRDEWPGCALEVWVFAKAVKAALIRYLRIQAGEDPEAARLEAPPVQRYLAAAKRRIASDLQGTVLRSQKRVIVVPSRKPWEG